jgi:hypothetical protein
VFPGLGVSFRDRATRAEPVPLLEYEELHHEDLVGVGASSLGVSLVYMALIIGRKAYQLVAESILARRSPSRLTFS